MRFQWGATANIKPSIVLVLGLAIFSNGIPFARASKNSSKTDRPAPTVTSTVDSSVAEKEKRDLSGKTNSQTAARINENYGRIPLSFEANLGQAHASARFLSRGPGYDLLLSPDETILFLRNRETTSAIRMKLLNANPRPNVAGLDQLPGRTNYYLGNDPSKWRANVPNYAKVKYEAVYPGVDMVYYGNQQELEYDFIVNPGADPRNIKVNFAGVTRLRIDRHGELVMNVDGGEVRQHRPVVYQEISGQRQEIASRYVLKGKRTVGFAIGDYDATKPLVIDPILTYATLLGGNGSDKGFAIAIDSSGNAYVTGETNSNNFPVVNAAQPFWGGGIDSQFNRLYDAFITKLNAAGTQFLYTTYLGGNRDDAGEGIAVDSNGNAYVTGTTAGNFPQLNAIQAGPWAVWAAKLNASGGLSYSTYLRGSGDDVVVDSSDCPYFVGRAGSGATTVNGFQTTYGGGDSDGFVQKLNAAGTTVLFASYLGGSLTESRISVRLDSNNDIYVAGSTTSTNFPVVAAYQQNYGGGDSDAFLAKISSATNTVVYSTYLGGSHFDNGEGVAVDGDGNAYVTGQTSSTNFAVTAGAFQTTSGGNDSSCSGLALGCSDAYVTKFNAAGNGLVYSTRIGGSRNDRGEELHVDDTGHAYLLGGTSSINFPTLNGLGYAFTCCATDVFLTKFNPAGSAVIYSTYYGSESWEIWADLAVDSSGNVYIGGTTDADPLNGDLPLVNPIQSTYGGGNGHNDEDAFIAKISDIEGFVISGHVKDTGENPVAGVTMTLSGSRTGTAITDSSGNYSFTHLGPGENLTVTPSKNLYSFSPTSQTINNLSANATADFVGTPLSQFQISGHIQHSDGSNVAGAIVNLSGSQSRTTTTDASGNYAFTLLVEGENFIVTPSMPISYTLTYTFSPLSQTFNNLTANQTANFTRSSATNLTIYPAADATVQDGVGASTNFGTATPLIVKTANQADQRRDIYMKFDLTAITRTITNAKLRIFAGLSVAGSVATTVHQVTDTTWSETTITWANKPLRGVAVSVPVTVTSTTYATYDIDITSHLVAQKAAGAEFVSLALHNGSNSTPHIEMNSREASTNKPQLFLTTSDDNNAAPTVSLTSPSNGGSFTALATVPLQATASDSDGSISKVDFYAGTKFIGTAATSPYNTTWPNVEVGNYSIIAVAIDNSGSATASTAATISVTVPNGLPSVSITSPLPNSIFAAGSNLTITADASDVNGSVTQVEFFTGTTSIGVDTTAPYSVPWNNVAAGVHSLTAKATDNHGGLNPSSPVVVNVVWQTGLSSTHDAYVRDGASAGTNFGTAQELHVHQSAGSNRDTYLRFDLTSVTNVVKAKLRVRGRLSDASGTNVPVGAHSVSNITWTETTVTWNNKPAATDPALSTQTITDNVARWYEFDVTAWVKPQRDGGQPIISLALKSQAASTPHVIFDSKESTNGRPQLLLWTTTSTRNALFAVGSSNLGTGDSAVKTRLENLGYTVTVQVANNGLITSQADGKAVVVISSTVNDGNVTNKFRHVAVPVVVWESLVLDDMGMTGTTSGTHFGTLAAQTQVNIVTPSHPMAAGLSSGAPVPVASPSSTFTWGKTNANAVQIAALTTDATKFPIFGYDAGANMPGADGVSAGLDAPARRVAVFMSDTTAASNFGGTSGGALFDAAIKWAAEVVTAPTIISVTPTLGPVTTVVTITGLNFGIAQGSSTLTFNGVAAVPASWADRQIVASVPIFSSTGPIVVTVNGVASNGLIFSVGDVDSDSDGLPDWWEIQYFGNLSQTASGDPDGDSLTNLQEFQQGRNPTKNALADDGSGVNLRLHTPLAPSTP